MPNEKERSHEGETVYQTVRGAVAGDDEPMEDGHPNATGILVAGVSNYTPGHHSYWLGRCLL